MVWYHARHGSVTRPCGLEAETHHSALGQGGERAAGAARRATPLGCHHGRAAPARLAPEASGCRAWRHRYAVSATVRRTEQRRGTVLRQRFTRSEPVVALGCRSACHRHCLARIGDPDTARRLRLSQPHRSPRRNLRGLPDRPVGFGRAGVRDRTGRRLAGRADAPPQAPEAVPHRAQALRRQALSVRRAGGSRHFRADVPVQPVRLAVGDDVPASRLGIPRLPAVRDRAGAHSVRLRRGCSSAPTSCRD